MGPSRHPIHSWKGSASVAVLAVIMGSGPAVAQPAPAPGLAPVQLAQVEGPGRADRDLASEGDDTPALDADYYPLDVPLAVNGAVLGEVALEATLSGFARMDPQALIDLIADKLGPERTSLLEAMAGRAVALADIEAADIQAVYDPATLTLKLSLSLDGVQRVSVSGRTRDAVNLDAYAQPARLAAATSLVLRPRYQHRAPSGGSGWDDFSADLRGFVSAGGFSNWALAYELDYLENRPSPVRRGDVAVIHDDFDSALRLVAGDVRPSITAFQSSLPIAGISVERNFAAIQPFRTLRPGGRTSFILERPSRVTFEVNGTAIQTLDLEPGTFDIQDFPLITGSNQVRVLVDDDFGTREIGRYSTYVDTSLLADGISVYGLSVGVPRRDQQTGFGYSYDDKLVATGFFERGLSDRLTLGGQLELSGDGGYAGGRAVVGLGRSVVGLEAGASNFKTPSGPAETGAAAAASWALRPEDLRIGGMELFQANLSVEHRTDGFQTLGDRGFAQPGFTRVAGQAALRRGSTSLSVGGAWTRNDTLEIGTLNASLRLPVSFANVSVGYQLSERRERGGLGQERDTDHRVLLSLSRNFGPGGVVTFRGATNPDFGEVEWRRFAARSVDSWSGRASVRVGEDIDEVLADATWIAPFGEFDMRHTTVAQGGFGRVERSQTEFRIGVGAGWADGDLAVGRPAAQGFVIARPHESLEGRALSATRGTDLVEARSSALVPGDNVLVPLLGVFREQRLGVDVADLPLGYDLGSGLIEVFPSRFSGYTLPVGSEPGIMVIGTLRDATGEPKALVAGALSPAGGGEAIEVFTNRTGRFVAENAQPGTYALTLRPDNRRVATIEVVPGEEGILRIGDVVMEEGGAPQAIPDPEETP